MVDPHVTNEAFGILYSAAGDVLLPRRSAYAGVAAAIQGGCIGGAVDMTSACDIRYCTENAFFCIQEINIGMTADVGTFPRPVQVDPGRLGSRNGLYGPGACRA